MKNPIIPFVLACSLWCSIPAFAQEQQQTTAANITVSTSSTLVPSTSATFQEAYSRMLDTFPQKVLSTISTILENSTNATAQGEQKDSLLKKDNLALQGELSWSGAITIGAKYWLSELTALQFEGWGGFSVGAGASSSQNSAWGTRMGQRDTSVTNGYTFGQVMSPNLTTSVNINCGVSASIEKHIFASRHISPFLSFSTGISVYSANELGFSTPLYNVADSNANINLPAFYSSIPANARDVDNDLRLKLFTRTSITVSGSIKAGMEYFIFHWCSVSAQAGISTWITGIAFAQSDNTQEASKFQGNQFNYNANQTVNTKIYSNNGQTSFGLSGGANFTSSLTLSLYFGRNVLGDIVNAFKSGTLFQW